MKTIINVQICSYNAFNQGIKAYIGLDVNNKGLVLKAKTDYTTKWTLIPNIVAGAVTGGFALYNETDGGCAKKTWQPDQIQLGSDTPYGLAEYCWTLWPVGTWQFFNNQVQLWGIQDYQRGDGMDAEGSGTGDGTRILLYPWNGGDNQQWFFQSV